MTHVAGVNVTRHRTGRVSGSKAEPRQVLQPAANQARLRPRRTLPPPPGDQALMILEGQSAEVVSGKCRICLG